MTATMTIDEKNDAIRAQVERELPAPAGGFESDDEADAHRAKCDARYLQLAQYSADVETLFDKVEEALVDFAMRELRGDFSVNWHALRIRPDGETYISQEASPCYSESEYFNRVPHTLTLCTRRGNGWTPSVEENPGFLVNDDGTLDLGEYVGDSIDTDIVCHGWRETLQNWIDSGNFTGFEVSK